MYSPITQCRCAIPLVALVFGTMCAELIAAAQGAGQSRDDNAEKTAARAQSEINILFVGNSHTASQGMPDRVREMIEFVEPQQSVRVELVVVTFLDGVKSRRAREKLDSRRWDFVVLQGQKISMSGKYDYSTKEGIEFARRAKKGGAKVIFFAEWGLRGKEGDGQRTKKIYQSMADESGASVAPIPDAWDKALAERPDLPLFLDGNHQSELGSILTACVLVGAITGESPERLAKYPCRIGSVEDRKFLAETAAAVFQTEEQP